MPIKTKNSSVKTKSESHKANSASVKTKNKSFKTIIYTVILVLLAGFCASWLSGCFLFNDYVHITDFDYRAVLLNNGRVSVTERITFDIHASSSNNPFWELYRDLPEEWEYGTRVTGFDVKSVKQVKDDGSYFEFGKAKDLYEYDSDYIAYDSDLSVPGYGPNRWFHSQGPYDDVNNFECLMIYVDGLYRETAVFEIEYEIYGAAIKYADCSELYLPMCSDNSFKYLNSFSAEILIPQNLMPVKDYKAWTYGTASYDFPFDESKNTNGDTVFSFSLNKEDLKFKPHTRFIEFALVAYGDDKHSLTPAAGIRSYNEDVFSDLLKKQEEYENQPAKYNTIKTIVLIVVIILSAVIILSVVLSDRLKRKKYKFSKPSVDYEFFREIPSDLDANFAAAFVFCKHKISDDVKGGYSAAMLGLVRKNYIQVELINQNKDWTPSNTKIVVVGGATKAVDPFDTSTVDLNASSVPKKPMTQTEAAYYNLIVRHAGKGVISLKDLESRVAADYQYTGAFAHGVKNSVKTIGVAKGYFKQQDYKRLKVKARSNSITLSIIGAIILVVANVISSMTWMELAFGAFFILSGALFASAILLILFSKSYVLLTEKGEDEYAKWRGLYNFLNSETLMNQRTVSDMAIWEDYLLYATAFGISEKVLKALKVNFPEFNQSSSIIIRHPFLTSMVFTHIYARSFRGAARRASVSRFTGGGGFGGGGYGSGGRGGGFGGGGH